ncbi:hypothetical protein PP939_gp140 [Rhizobium phage RL38J1]|uniref:Uncharacterized protein n=1 Tax=Rhizobium phage RL38J1 TaxID=2663232 RepID=A0A6B9J1C0_9CAUD|nr:hypothetical protein PP939_gp140 [Rhizobium phage RL38J1]QGZ14024.1 hypothetical protein RL38J1_140 [Rhizobium phage RL38J1]
MTDYTIINAVAADGKAGSLQITTSNLQVSSEDRDLFVRFIARYMKVGVTVKIFVDSPSLNAEHFVDEIMSEAYNSVQQKEHQ